MNKQVHHPDHYQGLECIEAMEIAYGTEAVACFCLCNRFKYLARAGKKDKGRTQEDKDKAQWYGNYYTRLKAKVEKGEGVPTCTPKAFDYAVDILKPTL